MIKELTNYLKNKKILILGFGLEGQSSYRFIRKYLPDKKLYIADRNENFEKSSSILKNENNSVYISGENYLDSLTDFDLILKTPGISFAGINTSSFLNRITSQLELLLEFFNVFTIGVTGTKGKSTTSSLMYEVLKSQNKNVMLLGNIGTPVFDKLDEMSEDMILVLEMSSHQLEFMHSSPNIAILLNIYEEHLDHYNSFDEYAGAKCNIFKYQKQGDFFLYSLDNKTVKEKIKNYNILSKKYEITLDHTENINRTFLKNNIVSLNGKKLYNAHSERNLIGRYNLSNIMFILTVSEILGLDLSKTICTINSFTPLPHRMEKVGEFDGVIYYNDSIATIPEATINSIESLGNVNTLIIGGMDRGVSFDEFIHYLNNSKIENLICMPDTGFIIGRNITNSNIHVFMECSLESAVSTAKKVTKKGCICLLSPAAASYRIF